MIQNVTVQVGDFGNNSLIEWFWTGDNISWHNILWIIPDDKQAG